MRFLIDMCVDVRIVTWLREQGHDAIHLREQGLQRLPDEEIFRKGISENRVIVTFDLDFSEIAALSCGQKISVIVFRLNNTRSFHVINRLSDILKLVSQAIEKGAIKTVEESRYRVRYFPIIGDMM